MKGETKAHRITRSNEILDRLSHVYGDSFEGLQYSSVFELLVATMLSAQSTDKLVNSITPALFAKYSTPQDYLSVDVSELESDIYSSGFYKAKARNIRACCEVLIARHNSQVPSTAEELIRLPGVGRKTANCILSNYYGVPAITVDTHVMRLSQLLGLCTATDPVKIEAELQVIVPESRWNEFNRDIINHGRAICIARRPQCDKCVVADLCPSKRDVHL